MVTSPPAPTDLANADRPFAVKNASHVRAQQWVDRKWRAISYGAGFYHTATLSRLIPLTLVAVWMVALVVATERRLPDWRDEVTIWRAAVAADPASPTAHNTYGQALLVRDRGRESEPHFRLEVAQRPERIISHVMLGFALAKRGATAEADAEWAIVNRMAAQRFQPGANHALAHRGDMIQGVVFPPQPGLAKRLGIEGASPDAPTATR